MKVNEKHEDCCKDNSQRKKCGAFQNYATPNKVRRLDCIKNNLPDNVKNILFFFLYELKRQKSHKIHFLRRNFSSRRFIVPPRYRSLFFSFDHRGTQRVEAGKNWSKGISRGST